MDENFLCRDSAFGQDSHSVYWTESLRHALRQSDSSHLAATAETCQDCKAQCGNPYMAALRLLCPVTCGCDSPRSGLNNRVGCPRECMSTRRYEKVLTTIDCTDPLPGELVEDANWT